MSATETFIAATLEARSEHRVSTVQWSAPESVRVAVNIEQSGRSFPAEHIWLVPADAAAGAQHALKAVQEDRGDGATVVVLAAVEKPATKQAERIARQTVESISHLRYSEALTAHRAGGDLLTEGDRAAAIGAFQTGIAALGDLYESPQLDDDTDLKLALGEDALAGGRLDQAAALIGGVLESRLIAYRELRVPESAAPR